MGTLPVAGSGTCMALDGRALVPDLFVFAIGSVIGDRTRTLRLERAAC